MELVKSEGMTLVTKGLWPRVIYNGVQSIVLFNFIKYIGKAFGVQIEDD